MTVHRVDDDRRRERITLQQTIHPLPGDFAGAMATAKPFPPEPDDTPPESVQRIRVARDPVVREVTAKLLTQCLVLFGHRVDVDSFDTIPRWPSVPDGNRLLDVLRFTTQLPRRERPQ